MASASAQSDLGLAEKLKGQLKQFITDSACKQDYELFFGPFDQAGENKAEVAIDWFIYEWFDENGEGVIDRFLGSNQSLSEREREILIAWQDSINSVFEICSLGKYSMRLKEIDSGDTFSVTTIKPLDRSPFKRGQFIAARLLPLGNKFIFAGQQLIMPTREAAQEALKILRSLDSLDSPEAIEQAQREQCNAFCEFFGQAELTVPLSELKQTLERFQHYLFFERRDNGTNVTIAEMFYREFGRELKLPDMPVPPSQIAGVKEVTIICDEFDGLVLLPEYNRFKRVFETDDPDREVIGWRELVWEYIKNPDIPIVAFERVAETHAEQLERILRVLLGDKNFSIEHLYAVLLHYKEPVEGFEELEDDQRLWDLFDGSRSRKAEKPMATSTKKTEAAAGKPAPRAKNKPVAGRSRRAAPAKKR
jgi:hypothetical protein